MRLLFDGNNIAGTASHVASGKGRAGELGTAQAQDVPSAVMVSGRKACFLLRVAEARPHSMTNARIATKKKRDMLEAIAENAEVLIGGF